MSIYRRTFRGITPQRISLYCSLSKNNLGSSLCKEIKRVNFLKKLTMYHFLKFSRMSFLRLVRVCVCARMRYVWHRRPGQARPRAGAPQAQERAWAGAAGRYELRHRQRKQYILLRLAIPKPLLCAKAKHILLLRLSDQS